MRRFSQLLVVLAILLSGTVLVPYAAFSPERFGWQSFADVYQPDLSVTKVDSSDPVAAGDTLTYTLTVTNNGDSVIPVILRDTLPESVTFGSATISQGVGCSKSGDTVTCNLEDVAGGASATVTIVVTPTSAGLIINTANAMGNTTTEYTNIFTEPVTTVVDPTQGGTLVYVDAQGLTTTIEAPPNAVTQPTTLAYIPIISPTKAISPNLSFAGHAFTLEASQGGNPQPGFAFESGYPVAVTIHYTDTDVADVWDERSLTLDYWDGSQWVDAATTCTPPSTYDRHPDANWLAVPICHLSEFALLGPRRYRIYLPVVLKNR